MNTDPIIDKFLSDICTAFPEIRSKMEAHEDFMTASRMEEFANATTDAFSQADVARGMSYLSFMSERLNVANSKEYEAVDVYYVENLFWPPHSDAAKLGWPLVPDNLKALYLRFHGKSPL
jgi:hypothetical protein